MIYSIFHKGSGLGNQLARYIFARCFALDNGYDFSMICPENFKGNFFLDFHTGKKNNIKTHIESPSGKVIIEDNLYHFEEKRTNNNGVDIRGYDDEIRNIKDNTIVDGEFQDEKYFIHRIDEAREWLKVEPLKMSDTLCVINFRGGEYVGTRLFLPKKYWDLAIAEIRKINQDMKFEVHTDDMATARQFFPNYPIISDIALNWRSIRYAKYLILSNSSFAILPALLNENAEKIYAPNFWGGYNIGIWSMEQNKYTKFSYI